MGTRILVVDDDRLVADTLTLIFRSSGYESTAAYSAADGLAKARACPPCLVLCDVTMPEENGLTLAERLHAEQPTCKMLMLSGYSSNAAKVDLHALQMKRPLKLLAKPCRPELLLQEANALLFAS